MLAIIIYVDTNESDTVPYEKLQFSGLGGRDSYYWYIKRLCKIVSIGAM